MTLAKNTPLDKNAKIYIAGHKGLVGSAILKFYLAKGFTNIITKTHSECDLVDTAQVENLFKTYKPDYVFCAAAKVGGIHANNTYKASFIYENIMIQTNIIHQSYLHNVKKLLFLGSSCIYPKFSAQPIKEESLLTGALEQTNDAYAVAKIAGIKMCQSYNDQYRTNFISVMPTNMYGPNDNYDLKNSHVLPALIRKFHEAKETNSPTVTLWGTGKALREFLYADDCAHACHFLMENYQASDIINVGTGTDQSILDLAMKIKSIVGYEGNIEFDSSMPDGTPKKQLDVTKLFNLGWNPTTSLEDGIKLAYKDFLSTYPR
jgi:GDP-L-fucose synthase